MITPPPKTSRFEAMALKVFHAMQPPVVLPGGHMDLEAQGRFLRSMERKGVARAAFAGVLSGIASGVAAWWADPILPADGAPADYEKTVLYWAIVGGVTVVASVLEIGFLYWDGLFTVRKMGRVADVHYQVPERNKAFRELSLARAGLEIPNPNYPVLGIDPLCQASKLRLLIWALIYKVKVGLTSFLFKAAVKRLAGRSLARGYVEFFAIPVIAIWNALVCRWVMREARIRALGPQVVDALYEDALPGGAEALDEESRDLIYLAIKTKVIHAQDFHPNVFLFLERFVHEAGIPDFETKDVDREFLERLRNVALPKAELAIKVLETAIALDGKMIRQEKDLILAARKALGLDPDLGRVEESLRFVKWGAPRPAISPEPSSLRRSG